MALQYSPKIVLDSLVMCLDASQNKSYPAADLPVKNGLVMWMDAADDTTFSYSSGSTVSQWRDKSGFNYHMVPVSAGPTRNAFLNSRKVIACTTSQQIWNSSINLVTSAYTIFGVTRLTGTTNARVLSTQYVPSTGGNWLLGHWAGYVNQYYAEGWVSGPYGTGANTAWNIFMGDWSGSSTDLANLYTNGTAIVTNSNGANAGPIGLGINVNSETSTCEAAEIVVFNRVLTITERKLVNTYLGQKWGISNTDRSIIDLSGNDDNGLFGNGTGSNMPLFDYYNKGAFLFDGSNDYIVIPNSSSLKSTSALTVEAWVLISSSMNYYGAIVGKGVSDTNEEYCLLVHYVNNKVYFDVGSGGGPYVDASYTFALNTWYHISATHLRASGSSDIKIYINGSQVSGTVVNPTNAVNDNTDNVTIGSRFTTPTSIWNGKIGSVKIYNRNLSATEILQNYEAQKSKFANTIVQQGLVLNLDAGNPYSYAGAGTTWYDVSGNGNNGTFGASTAAPTYNSDSGGVIVFDGTDDRITSFPTQISGTGSKTINCFFKTSKTVRNGLCGIRDTSVLSGWVFTVNRSAAGNLTYFHTGGSIIEVAAGISINTWYNACVTYDTSTATVILYLNGVQIGSPVTSFSVIPSSTFNGIVGGEDNAFNDPFGGSIGLVQIYNIALSAAQVLQNYNATKGRFGL
jgi:hypothetical protein